MKEPIGALLLWRSNSIYTGLLEGPAKASIVNLCFDDATLGPSAAALASSASRRSNLVPTRMIGTPGAWWDISGYHLDLEPYSRIIRHNRFPMAMMDQVSGRIAAARRWTVTILYPKNASGAQSGTSKSGQ